MSYIETVLFANNAWYFNVPMPTTVQFYTGQRGAKPWTSENKPCFSESNSDIYSRLFIFSLIDVYLSCDNLSCDKFITW